MEEGQLADQSASRHVTHKNGSVVLMTRNEMHRTASEVLAQGGKLSDGADHVSIAC